MEVEAIRLTRPIGTWAGWDISTIDVLVTKPDSPNSDTDCHHESARSLKDHHPDAKGTDQLRSVRVSDLWEILERG
jgi:hypothetical protein